MHNRSILLETTSKLKTCVFSRLIDLLVKHVLSFPRHYRMAAYIPTVTLLIVSAVLQYCVVSTSDNFIKERDCPLQCTCSEYVVNCSSISSFPERLPVQTVEFYISDSTISHVPRNAFLGLPQLQRISMTTVTIDILRACSFAEIENTTAITFNDVTIGRIEGNAFSNLFNVTKISFEDSVIDEINSYAIHGVRELSTLSFMRTNITVIHSYAFLQIDSVDEFSIVNCNISTFLRSGFSKLSNFSNVSIKDTFIEDWQCGSLEPLMNNDTKLSVTQSWFNCDCGLAWLWSTFPNAPVRSEQSNRCLVSGNRISTVLIENVCPVVESRNEGCPGLHPSIPHSCSRKFDTPYQPDEKIDYPSIYVTKPPAGSKSGAQFCHIAAVLNLAGIFLFGWMVCG